MNKIDNYKYISLILSAAGFVFIAWITFGSLGFQGAPIVASLTLGCALALVKLGVKLPSQYWSTCTEPAQVRRIALMIATALSLQLAIGGAIQVLGWTFVPEILIGPSVWIGTSLAFIGSGIVKWPQRRARPPKRDFIIVSVAALLVAIAFSASAIAGRNATLSPEMLARAGEIVTLSTTEEIVFRVLLLTALLQESKSRTSALVISSFVFGLGHAPLALAQPIIAMDWPYLAEATKAYLPNLVWQTGLGFCFGALWLRTGSIALIALVHVVLNLSVIVG